MNTQSAEHGELSQTAIKQSRYFVIADTHFGHKNIIQYGQRPFKTVEEMDARMKRQWRQLVKPEDIVIHVGDFAFGNIERRREVLTSLPGQKILIRGNHDDKSLLAEKRVGWDFVCDGLTLRRGQDLLYFTHAPLTKPFSEDITWVIHGHIHIQPISEIANVVHKDRHINVCVEHIDYRPILIDTLLNKITKGHGA